MSDVIGQLLQDNNMPDTPTARAIYRKMLEQDDDTQVSRKPWVGLTDEDVTSVIIKLQEMYHRPPIEIFARAIETKLKEKNA